MKKLFFVLLAFVAFSFTACKSGGNKTETMDTTQVEDLRKEAQDAVKDNTVVQPDTTMTDTAK